MPHYAGKLFTQRVTINVEKSRELTWKTQALTKWQPDIVYISCWTMVQPMSSRN